MRNLLLLLFVLLSTLSFSQVDDKIIEAVNNYPDSFSSIEMLTDRINSDFTEDEDKAAAIFTWIALNIRYDTRSFFSSRKPRQIRFSYRTEEERIVKEQEIRRKTADKALDKGKAVCQGYSELYRQACILCNIECEVVSGYSKTSVRQIGKRPNQPAHAWNAVKLNNQWYLVDVTWAAGSVNFQTQKFVPEYSPEYFRMNPVFFALNHYPRNERWLLTELTFEQFINLPVFFRSFFSSGSEIISPLNGRIEETDNGLIKIELKSGESPDRFSYHFSNSRYGHIAQGKINGENIILEIPAENTKSSYLNIFYKNKIFISYKVRLK